MMPHDECIVPFADRCTLLQLVGKIKQLNPCLNRKKSWYLHEV